MKMLRASQPPRRALLGFILAYATLSFLFSLLSWGQASPRRAALPTLTQGLALESGMHVVFGLLAALPSRRWSLMAAGGVGALAIDVDHLGEAMGLPMVGRASHSVGFLVLVGIVFSLLGRGGILGREWPAATVGAVASAAVLAHLALDAVVGDGQFPLGAPVSFELVGLTRLAGIGLQAAAMGLVWAVESWPGGRDSGRSRPGLRPR